jgi:hypothetical protein
MYQNFDKMSTQSRIWIYQADRKLTAKEENIAAYSLKEAVQSWASHGSALLGSVDVIDSRFLVIALDEHENAASGCSIDSSTHWVKELGKKLGVDFFDRSLAYIDGKETRTIPVFSVRKAIENGAIDANTIVYNNTISNLQGLVSNWKIPAEQLTFIKRYFKKEVA